VDGDDYETEDEETDGDEGEDERRGVCWVEGAISLAIGRL
jgi:hypothetical protein